MQAEIFLPAFVFHWRTKFAEMMAIGEQAFGKLSAIDGQM